MSAEPGQIPASASGSTDTAAPFVSDDRSSLWGGLWRVVERGEQAITSLRAKKDALEKAQKRWKSQLGPWYEELVVEDELCKKPILKTAAFEAYLQDTDLVITPDGSCAATAGWVVFLHALGVGPQTTAELIYRGMRRRETVVSFVPVESKSIVSDGLTTSLQMSGEALCHVINIFGRYRNPLETDFGEFFLEAEGAVTQVSFRQSWPEAVNATRIPFGRSIGDTFEPGTRWQSYLNVLDPRQLVTPSKLVWPDSKTPLRQRLEALHTNLQCIERFRPEQGHGILLSRKWREGALRIGLRATSNGGKDKSLYNDALRLVSMECARRLLEKSDAFCWDEKAFKLYDYRGVNLSVKHSDDGTLEEARGAAADALTNTLDSYETGATGSWQRNLFDAKDEVIQLILAEKVVCYDPRFVRVIPYDPDTNLWKSMAEVQDKIEQEAPVSTMRKLG